MKQEIKERIELINKGIVPAGYKKTPVGICPIGWDNSFIGEVTKQPSYGLNKSAITNEKYPKYIRITDIDNNGKYLYSNAHVDCLDNNYFLHYGDIVFARTGATTGKNYLYNPRDGELVFAGFLIKFSADQSKIIPSLLFYYCNTNNFWKYVNICSQRSGQPGLNIDDIQKFKINIVRNLLEQQKIAEILNCATRQVELQEQLVDKLKVQKKALMQKLLTPQPDWQKDKLEKLINEGLITLYRGKVISKEDIKKFPGNYPIYSSSVINNGEMGEYGKYMFDEELITWSIDGGGNFFYRNKHKFSVTNVCGYIKINTNYFNYKFLAEELIYLHSKLSFDYMLKAHPSVIKKIYTINYPNLKEQTKIAKLALNLDKQIELQQKLLEQYKLRQKALMQLLLTGIVRVCK